MSIKKDDECIHEWTNAYGLAPKVVRCKLCGAIGVNKK